MTGDTFEALLAPNLPSVRRFVQTRVRTSDHADDVDGTIAFASRGAGAGADPGTATHRRDGLVFRRPFAKGQAIEALSRRSRQP